MIFEYNFPEKTKLAIMLLFTFYFGIMTALHYSYFTIIVLTALVIWYLIKHPPTKEEIDYKKKPRRKKK